jgi:hypothetical protein
MERDGNDEVIDAADINRVARILSELEASDFDLVDPPAEIWKGIEASVTSGQAASPRPDGPRQPPARDPWRRLVVEYSIDADDIVTVVGENWADFARDNDAPEMAVPASNRTLWTYMDRHEVRELWQLLVQRVRTLQAPARVALRCDAPHTRRWFEMTITPEPDGVVHFQSILVFEEPRPPVPLLDLHARRDADAQSVPLCSWCGRAQHGSRWLDIEEVVRVGRLLELESLPPISYGICGVCRSEMSAELLVPGSVGGAQP